MHFQPRVLLHHQHPTLTIVHSVIDLYVIYLNVSSVMMCSGQAFGSRDPKLWVPKDT